MSKLDTYKMQKTLNEFWNGSVESRVQFIEKHGGGNPLVTGLEYDSRKINKNNLYFALPGLHADGHNFIQSAIRAGASVIVYQNELPEYQDGIVYLRVKDSRYAMSAISAEYYGNPCKHLKVIGVTGTEGKSTTVYLIFQLLRSAGKKCGFISTVQFSTDGTEQWNSEHQTTPEATQIHKLLALMVDKTCEYAVVESSSHGLSVKTNRLGDVIFDAAVMTNVTHEHLEFHGTWEQYRDDKANLFRSLGKTENCSLHKKDIPAFGVVNADDKSADYFAASTKHKTWTHSVTGNDADFSVLRITPCAQGNTYDVKCRSGEILHIEDNLPGAFNAGNVLAAIIVVSQLLKMPASGLLPFVKELKPVRGRMTPVEAGQNFEVIVDYAHTPSSFQTIFPPLRERLDSSGGRIITLFGSAGERDTQKRPRQGEIAARYSDVIILTDEDPRGDDAMSILEDIAAGVESVKTFARGENLFLICDRPQACLKALSLAKAGDLVLLLGKGHENSIIYKTGAIPYDEITCAKEALHKILNLN